MKVFVCETCDAEFRLKHTMDNRLYKVMHCPFCGDDLNNELEDELEDYGEEYDE
tara:strand:+ start:762 stop:923 length:162 start_codon:yes stop_codon:yes gene_type:complete